MKLPVEIQRTIIKFAFTLFYEYDKITKKSSVTLVLDEDTFPDAEWTAKFDGPRLAEQLAVCRTIEKEVSKLKLNLGLDAFIERKAWRDRSRSLGLNALYEWNKARRSYDNPFVRKNATTNVMSYMWRNDFTASRYQQLPHPYRKTAYRLRHPVLEEMGVVHLVRAMSNTSSAFRELLCGCF